MTKTKKEEKKKVTKPVVETSEPAKEEVQKPVEAPVEKPVTASKQQVHDFLNNEPSKVLTSYKGEPVTKIGEPRLVNGRIFIDVFTAKASYMLTDAEYKALLQ